MPKVLVIGAAYVDMVVNVQRLPQSGEDVAGEWRSTQVGGSAFNVQRALTYAGVAADLLVPVGQGEHATIVRETLRRLDIPILIEDTSVDNGWDVSFVEANGERAFLSIAGVERRWRAAWFEQLTLAEYDYVYLSGYELEDPQAAKVILAALAEHPHLQILFDTSPRIAHIDPVILQQLFRPGVIIHGNLTEIEQLGSATASYQETAQRLNALTNTLVVVTLDAGGAYYVEHGVARTVPSETVQVVNSIGAGDTHCGGLLAGLAAGEPTNVAIQRANHLASLVVTRQTGALTVE